MSVKGDAYKGQDGGEPAVTEGATGPSALLAVNSPSWGVPDEGAVERLRAALGDDAVVRTREHRGELTVVVPPARLVAVLAHLRDVEGYDFLSHVTVTDYLGYRGEVAGYWGGGTGLRRDMNRVGSAGKGVVPEAPGDGRFAVVYDLLKLMTVDPGAHRRVRVQVWLEEGQPLDSAVPVYPSADYHEREAYDFFGIPFAGHPNLRRIFMPEDWGGHPQRKDYPIGGEPVQFSDVPYDGGEE